MGYLRETLTLWPWVSLVFSPLFCFCCSCSASFKAREIPIPPHACSGVPMSQLRKEMDENSQQGWCVCNPERVKEKPGKQSCSFNLLLPLALDLGSLAGQEDKSEIQGLPTLFKMIKVIMFSSVQSVMSNSLWPHGLQYTSLPYPSPTPEACSKSCPSNQWCHPTISSSVIPYSYCLQSFTASGSFPVSHLFAQGGQSIEVSASASVLPMNTQDWSPLG